MNKPANVSIIPDPLLERMAKAGYEEVVKRTEHLRDADGRTWETETAALREDWRAIALAMQQASGATRGKFRATGRRAIVPFAASAVVLALLGGYGVASWTARPASQSGVAEAQRASAALPAEEPKEAVVAGPAVDTSPASGGEPEAMAATPAASVPPAVSPPALPGREASRSDPTSRAEEKPEPQKTSCTVEPAAWPADNIGRGRVIQILLRDLGFYNNSTNGTVGPVTRAAIRKFQHAAGEAETGEPSKALFDSLQKKCASAGR